MGTMCFKKKATAFLGFLSDLKDLSQWSQKLKLYNITLKIDASMSSSKGENESWSVICILETEL